MRDRGTTLRVVGFLLAEMREQPGGSARDQAMRTAKSEEQRAECGTVVATVSRLWADAGAKSTGRRENSQASRKDAKTRREGAKNGGRKMGGRRVARCWLRVEG